MSEEKFETEKYKFLFRQIQEAVLVTIMTVEGTEITEENIQEIKDFFGDMGKWEIMADTGLNILGELRLMERGETSKRLYGFDRYVIEYEKQREYLISGVFHLTRKERLRRSGGVSGAKVVLPLSEIVEQVKNIPKWRQLMRLIAAFKRGY